MSKITVKNISSATVSLFDPIMKLNKELIPGRVIPLTEEMYEDLSLDPGFVALLRGHYIRIDGIEEDEQVEIINDVYSKEDIDTMLEKKDITNFAKFIPKATAAEKETIIKLAVDKGITDNAFAALIKKYCDVDLINAINMKHQSEEK